MKKFFGIEEKQYVFEWGDISALLTVLNVFFIVMGIWWAPFFGLANCVLAIVGIVKANAHLNAYIIQMALIVLNIFFLCQGVAQMFYYKTFYIDGTWGLIKSKRAIRNAKKDVCETCVSVKPLGIIQYYWLKITTTPLW